MRAYKSKLMRKFSKKQLNELSDDWGIVPNEKKNEEDFSWSNFYTKILCLKFYPIKLPTTEILSNLQGTRQRRIHYYFHFLTENL